MELFGKYSNFSNSYIRGSEKDGKTLGQSFISEEGDDVNMTTEDVFLYTLLPFGQLFMRMIKHGGSLDKPYLLLLLGPSFYFMGVILDPLHERFGRNIILSLFIMWAVGWITPLLGYYGLLNKVEGGSILDLVILIPIAIRFLLIILLINIGFDNNYKDLIMHGILFFIMMLTNFMHLMIRPQCNSSNSSNHGERFLKILMDTIFQYGIIFFILGWFLKTKMFAYELYAKPLGLFNSVGDLMETITWCLAAIFAYASINMIDVNYSTDYTQGYANDDTCKGNISALRISISTLLFVLGLLYFYYQNRYF
jgi:hypothetical protein